MIEPENSHARAAPVVANAEYHFEGKLAVLSGAGSGLTKRISRALADAGAHVVIVDIDGSAAETTATEVEAIGGQALAMQCDVSDAHDVLRLFREIDDIGAPDFLVNGAFVGAHVAPEELPLETWQRVMNVNVNGTFLLCQQAGRRMIERGEGGSIVNFSSIAGTSGIGRGNCAYSVSKAAIIQLTRELAVEWAPHGIRVNVVQPCQFLTPGLQRWLGDPSSDSAALYPHLLRGIPLGRFGHVDEIVGPVLFLLSESAAMITGAALPVDGGNLALNAGGGMPPPACDASPTARPPRAVGDPDQPTSSDMMEVR